MAETSAIFTDDSMELGRQFGVLEHYLKSTKAEKSVLAAYSFIAKRFNTDEEPEPETETEETEETDDTTEPADDDAAEEDPALRQQRQMIESRVSGAEPRARTAARWTPEEDEYIKEKISQGVKPPRIGIMFMEDMAGHERTVAAVTSRAYTFYSKPNH